MLNVDELGARIIMSFGNGTVYLTESTLWGMIVAAVLAAAGVILGSGLKKVPQTKRQLAAEFIVDKLYSYVQSNLGKYAEVYTPFIGTMFLYLLAGSALGILGIRPITADVNVAFSLSILSFLLIQGSGIRILGLKGKVKHMCDPYPFMFPLNLIEEVTLPVSLAFRLFGNIFGGLVVVELWYVLMDWLSSFLSEIPFLRAVLVLPLNAFFDMFEPAIQTYIFMTLTMVFLSREITENQSQA